MGELFKSCQHPEDTDIELSAAKLKLIQGGNVLMDALSADPHLGYFVSATIPGKDNGFDIEGIVIYQNRLFFRFARPGDIMWLGDYVGNRARNN